MGLNVDGVGYELLGSGDNPTRELLNADMRQGVIICDADDRPTDPHVGMQIWETDTVTGVQSPRRWDGTYWRHGNWDYIGLDPTATPWHGTVPTNWPELYPRRWFVTDTATISGGEGRTSLAFPIPYTDVVFSVVAVLGDWSGFGQLSLISGDSTLAGLALIAFQPNGDVLPDGSAIRINYDVYGI